MLRHEFTRDRNRHVTVSVGAAEHLGPDEALDALVDRADRAMYTAKDSGRNMVVADAAVPPGAN